MKILALDQSSKITGYSIFEDGNLIKYGKFELTDSTVAARLLKIRKKITNLIQENNIEKVVFEDIQLQSNVTNNVVTFKTLAEVIGVIELTLTELNIPYESVVSTSWKSTLGIKGKTRPEQKRAAQNYVQTHFNITPTQDECDSICIGLHYLNKQNDPFDWSK